MALEVNGARGEVALTVGGVDLVIAATMAGLAAVSTRLECKSMADLFQRLSGVEPAATTAALELLTVRGDKAAAVSKLKLKHFRACAEAINAALAHQFMDDEGNDETAKPKAG
ncbi:MULTISPECIES: hypothetical protein [unclassified Mesorhizobium]|uniref:hypothetical protein n=1 Tax=unclassified Mesorhizobium TaxID=325217 RepID=UPI001128F380|nr:MULTISPECIES: hypothetical protein [unclassified Mesorhizobium]TPJ86959.1 hypothetical protein FJ489_30895 [Mesorhizobium sp. B2-5-12]TPK19182.1 hypothetical protein FJ562_31300 [Mesorhizobium sp. B2-5-6]